MLRIITSPVNQFSVVGERIATLMPSTSTQCRHPVKTKGGSQRPCQSRRTPTLAPYRVLRDPPEESQGEELSAWTLSESELSSSPFQGEVRWDCSFGILHLIHL